VRARMSQNGGVFIFTITPSNGADVAFTSEKILFQHSEKYVEETLTKTGFKLHKKTEVTYESGMIDLIYFAEIA
jgi:predicted TPR repeat methyltransferase